MIWYYLRSMDINVSKLTPVFVDNMNVVFNSTNPGSTLNKKSVGLSYHFVRGHVANNVVEVRKIHTSNNFSDPFTKTLVGIISMGFTMSAW